MLTPEPKNLKKELATAASLKVDKWMSSDEHGEEDFKEMLKSTMKGLRKEQKERKKQHHEVLKSTEGLQGDVKNLGESIDTQRIERTQDVTRINKKPQALSKKNQDIEKAMREINDKQKEVKEVERVVQEHVKKVIKSHAQGSKTEEHDDEKERSKRIVVGGLKG